LEQCKEEDDLPVVLEEDETVKSDQMEATSNDGAVLRDEESFFSNPQKLSPIFKNSMIQDKTKVHNESFLEVSQRDSNKRRRTEDESIDEISFMSTESTKKPKLTRAGSLKKHLGRRMSFGIVQPLNNLFRARKNSVDPNSSSCSNFETTFNDSIKEPIKEKIRQIKDKVSKFNKKDMLTPRSTKAKLRLASSNILAMNLTLRDGQLNTPEIPHEAEFKTPKAKSSVQGSLFKSNYVVLPTVESPDKLANQTFRGEAHGKSVFMFE
jgi:hypothetical protein